MKTFYIDNSDANVTEHSLIWSIKEFERLRSLDVSLFVGAVFNLASETVERGRADPASRLAITSIQHALAVSEPADWAVNHSVSRNEKRFQVSLADACGLSLVNFLPEMRQSVSGHLRRHFHAFGKNGGLGIADPRVLRKNAFFCATNPFDVLLAYSARSTAQAPQIAAFLENFSAVPWSLETFLTLDDYTADSRILPKSPWSLSKRKMWPVMHAAIAENTQALQAFEAVCGTRYKDMILAGSVISDSGQAACALDIAAKGCHAGTMALLLEQLKSSASQALVDHWVGLCLVGQVSESGLHKTNSSQGDLWEAGHDAKLSVFHAIMDTGGMQLLSGYDQLLDVWATCGPYQADEGRVSREAKNLALLCEKLASRALSVSHPEAIAATAHILERKNYVSGSCQDLQNPLTSMSLDQHKPAIIDRIFASLPPHRLARMISKSGEALLFKAAKAQNIYLAMALCARGVDTEARDARAWKAESYFKSDCKDQWLAFSASWRARAEIDAALSHSKCPSQPCI